jgi:chemotaxis methyl-accepting protein methylase
MVDSFVPRVNRVVTELLSPSDMQKRSFRRVGTAYLAVARKAWKHLPDSLRPLLPVRAYGRHVNGLVKRLAERTQSHGTFFFRNRPELQLLRKLVDRRASGASLEVSVLACSKGAEVYSIVWTIRSARPDLKLALHALDISPEILEFARNGAYSTRRAPLAWPVCSAGASEEDKLAWDTYRDQGGGQNLSIFERTTDDEMRAMFDREGDHVRIKAWLKEGISWHTGDANDPRLAQTLGPQDIVVANRFLCHMASPAAERCLRNVGRLVKPGGYLFVSGVDLDVRTRVARDLGWMPISDLITEVHEGDASLRDGWPLQWWGLEPFCHNIPNWSLRFASVFQIGEAIK